MPRKWCVANCRRNYAYTDQKVSVYQFPKNIDEQQKWIDALPNLVTVTPHIGVCRRHWSEVAELIKIKRYERPKDPPSIFIETPTSCVVQTKTKSREIQRRGISVSKRNFGKDQLTEFEQHDKLPSWSHFLECLRSSDIVIRHDLDVSFSA